MKGYIIGPTDGGEGLYTLVAEDGEGMCEHFCSNRFYAMGDLYSQRPERKPMFNEKGITEVVYVDEAPEMTRDLLIALNERWHAAASAQSDKSSEGE